MKQTRTVTTVLLAAAFVCAFAVTSFAQAFTDADAKVLKGKDPDAIAEVLAKLAQLNDSKGKDALKPAVPALIDCLNNELAIPEDDRWNLVDIVKVLSMTGDTRAKDPLLKVMSSMWGGGNPFTAQGFLKMGPTIVKDVSDSLTSKSPDTQGRAALTLYNMDKFDDTKKFFTAETRTMIRQKLVANLASADVNVRIFSITALRAFGDATVIPKLEYIEKNDAHKDSGGTYEVRIEATETLKVLKGAKK